MCLPPLGYLSPVIPSRPCSEKPPINPVGGFLIPAGRRLPAPPERLPGVGRPLRPPGAITIPAVSALEIDNPAFPIIRVSVGVRKVLSRQKIPPPADPSSPVRAPWHSG
jgi:hypothetical protein